MVLFNVTKACVTIWLDARMNFREDYQKTYGQQKKVLATAINHDYRTWGNMDDNNQGNQARRSSLFSGMHS